MGKQPIDPRQVQVWDFDPKANKLVEKPVQVRRIPPHNCQDCGECAEGQNPPPAEEEDRDFLTIRGDEQWAKCCFCGEVITEGDLTIPIAKWFKVYSRQEAPYPLEAGSVHAHLGCAVTVASQPRYSRDDCAAMVELCLDQWDRFNNFEKGAINDFHDMIVSGRELSQRQQEFLARMSNFAAKCKEEEPEGERGAPKLSQAHIAGHVRFIKKWRRYMHHHRRNQFDEILYSLKEGSLTLREQEKLLLLREIAEELEENPDLRKKPKWMRPRKELQKDLGYLESRTLTLAEKAALTTLLDEWGFIKDLTKEGHEILAELVSSVKGREEG